MNSESELVDQILLLPADQRAALARQIIVSLEPPTIDDDADAAWDAEIERRLGQVERGEVTPLDWRESINRVRESIARAAKA
jgi:putative addiction module component (TIGR02574 family)